MRMENRRLVEMVTAPFSVLHRLLEFSLIDPSLFKKACYVDEDGAHQDSHLVPFSGVL